MTYSLFNLGTMMKRKILKDILKAELRGLMTLENEYIKFTMEVYGHKS